ncbi:LysR family transcriptional regulator [Chitinivorax sp. B]|uniref:LysR family transcriptional regulator n=1 Tax=Chitinivorax sp. B TaxID=2502235 RepID=UPI0014859EBF|nr:LysR family transcriptional regulator [Chitinivorax sp. B]
MNIIERDFRGVDLNLLVTFLVLMRERSVSRAADKLHLGQPAVSGALARLRELFDDGLLVRTAQGMQPTAKALMLEAAIAPAIGQLQSALFEPVVFDPACDERTFTLGMPDWIDIWLMPLLFARLQATAPHIRIAVKTSGPYQTIDMLEKKEMDAGIAVCTTGPGWMRMRPLKTMGYCCVYDARQLGSASPITLPQYVQHTHLLVSYRGAFHGVVDNELAQRGLSRRVAFSTPHFAALPAILQQSSVLATVPAVLGTLWQNNLGLQVSPVPIPLPSFTVSMSWHATRDSDPALQWLLSQIESIVNPVAEGTAASLLC